MLVVAAGAIYPLIYLRQNFEITILDAFAITASELGNCYAMLGTLFVVTYVPSGWLADRIAPRLLMSFSLAFAGVLGIWFSTMPAYGSLIVIFAGWGIATGLTFWAALIKATAMLGRREEQGRFFGILDGGRGLVEAILATIAVALFAWWTSSAGSSPATALRGVIWLYTSFMLLLAPVVFFVVKPNRADDEAPGADGRAIVACRYPHRARQDRGLAGRVLHPHWLPVVLGNLFVLSLYADALRTERGGGRLHYGRETLDAADRRGYRGFRRRLS